MQNVTKHAALPVIHAETMLFQQTVAIRYFSWRKAKYFDGVTIR